MRDGVRLGRQHVDQSDAAAAKIRLEFVARDRRNRRAKHPLIVARRADCTRRKGAFHDFLRNRAMDVLLSRRSALAAAALVLIFGFASSVSAQYFGQNKV